MDSFNMNTFFGGISFDVSRLKDLSNCKKTQNLKPFYNKSIHHSQYLNGKWVRQGAICATLCASTAHHRLKTHETQSIKHVQRFRLVWLGVLQTSKAAFTFPLRVMTCSVSITQSQNTK